MPSGSCTFGAEFAELNRKAVALLETLCDELAIEEMRSSGSGCVGPRGDGYVICEAMAADDAAAYHASQIGTFAETGVDLVTAITMTHADEAVGIVRAMGAAGLPVVISFTARPTSACRTVAP